MLELIILALTLAADLLVGEPPAPLHPVVWVGKLISVLEKAAPRQGKAGQFLYGAFAVILTAGAFAAGSYFLLNFLKGFSAVLYVLAGAYLLKSTFSLRELARSAKKVQHLLTTQNLEDARFQMRSLVSRDVSKLGQPLIVAATIESVAENTSDSFTAPLFYFLIFGIPGAMIYRVVNTWDSMVGYHGKYEYLGKFPARLDDILNIIPSRLTGLLVVAAAYLTGNNGRSAWRIMFRDHKKTESPNAGWPMSAAAGALEVQLEKVGYYVLGDSGQSLTPARIDRAVVLMNVSGAIWIAAILLAGGIRFGLNA